MKVSVSVRGVAWRVIEVPEGQYKMAFSLQQNVNEVYGEVQDMLGNIECNIVENHIMISDPWDGSGAEFARTTYTVNIEDPDIFIYNKDMLCRREVDRVKYQKIDFGEIENRFEILDL
jgi:uncharacterized glyoxalase superfamily protein PhnB